MVSSCQLPQRTLGTDNQCLQTGLAYLVEMKRNTVWQDMVSFQLSQSLLCSIYNSCSVWLIFQQPATISHFYRELCSNASGTSQISCSVRLAMVSRQLTCSFSLLCNYFPTNRSCNLELKAVVLSACGLYICQCPARYGLTSGYLELQLTV